MKKNKTFDPWVDVRDDALMDSLGILWRKPRQPRDPSVWTKTAKEKEAIKKAKRGCKKGFSTSWCYTKAPIPVYGTLIIQIKNDKNFSRFPGDTHSKEDKAPASKRSKFTFSIQCGQSDIPRILDKYAYNKTVVDKSGKKYTQRVSVISKYKWCSQWYGPDELPFWPSNS